MSCFNVNGNDGSVIIGEGVPSSYAYDAFGRIRVSNPYTLFDSSNRYADNGKFATATTGTATATFNANEGLIDLDVGTASGDEVLRESYVVFAYQPGKSLLIMNSFTFDTAKTNLRQRVGYFGSDNGFYLEQNDSTISLVKRSKVTGSVVNTEVTQANFNTDKLDGTGPSGFTLDLTTSQLMFMDMEWLGAGSVRLGFVIEGQFIIAHRFDWANQSTNTGTYITTASLPIRYEITNTGTVASASQLKQICSTVISEGGYEMNGLQGVAGTPINSAYTLTTAGVFYPLVSIRLKSARLDAVALMSAMSTIGTGNNVYYNWKIARGGSITGGTWVSGGTDSAVEYNITGTAFTSTGSVDLASGYNVSSNQGGGSTDLLKEALFRFQLRRDSFTSTPEILTVLLATDTGGNDGYASMDWEEVTR
ncbi:hypothetical protein N9C16_04840 [Paracoccaceae bacterium]|nr:hypothetical protein [Paracoccaceae bacterium]